MGTIEYKPLHKSLIRKMESYMSSEVSPVGTGVGGMSFGITPLLLLPHT